ncbi:cyanophycinase [Flavobacterium sp. GT3R68]|uniref:cyanophycinase n=1 Tax=Flavobacterium sp. GT3R68 TaxID=2594437 RepID=UPI000F880A46|nr:cyanophycinase [Flavobacterium sp. GT3R68]RTY86795.1 cyanophycinase [Flavobacterium sp. GSN2]TRW89371.1 cyanophycinase [Flavobacterium sp. GT3R68]
MNIRGKLIIIGGAVDKGSFTETDLDKNVSNNLNFFEAGILRRVLVEAKHQEKSRIEVITTASKIPREIGPEYIKALNYLGATNVDVLHIERREQATDPEVLERLKAADVVMFTGGDQLRLTSILGGSLFHDILLDKYQNEDFIYAGTSAGAAAASNNMIYQGSSHEALLKGEVKITSGLGLIDGVIIDTHFVQRGRIGRLFQSVVGNPRTLGIGLGEDTGLLITNNSRMEAIGSGLVILVDGRQIKDTNLTEIELGQPISVNNFAVHVLSKFDTYDLKTHKMHIQSSQYI